MPEGSLAGGGADGGGLSGARLGAGSPGMKSEGLLLPESPAMRRRTRMRFRSGDDDILLTQVVRSPVSPFDNRGRFGELNMWEVVAARVNEVCRFQVDARRCRERTELVLRQFRAGERHPERRDLYERAEALAVKAGFFLPRKDMNPVGRVRWKRRTMEGGHRFAESNGGVAGEGSGADGEDEGSWTAKAIDKVERLTRMVEEFVEEQKSLLDVQENEFRQRKEAEMRELEDLEKSIAFQFELNEKERLKARHIWQAGLNERKAMLEMCGVIK